LFGKYKTTFCAFARSCPPKNMPLQKFTVKTLFFQRFFIFKHLDNGQPF
jgi:hypothetical protein